VLKLRCNKSGAFEERQTCIGENVNISRRENSRTLISRRQVRNDCADEAITNSIDLQEFIQSVRIWNLERRPGRVYWQRALSVTESVKTPW
jgi:hypothetical protein